MAKKNTEQVIPAAPALPALWHDITCPLNFQYAEADLSNSPFQALACRTVSTEADLTGLRSPMAFRLKLLGVLEELGQYLPARTRVEIVFTTTSHPASAQSVKPDEGQQ